MKHNIFSTGRLIQRYCACTFFTLLSFPVIAQEHFYKAFAPVKIQMDEKSVTKWYREYSGNSETELKLLHSRKDLAGNVHYKYRQYHNSLPVEKSMLNFHTNEEGIYALNGTIFKVEKTDSFPLLSAQSAMQIALNKMNALHYAWNDSNMQLLIRKAENDESASYYPQPFLCYVADMKADKLLNLAYAIDLYAIEPFQKKRFYIDAHKGHLLSEEQLLYTTDRPGKAHTLYSGIKTITCDSVSPANFYLTEKGRGGGIATYNAQKDYGATTINFFDEDNDWNNVNADRDEVATDIHWGLEMTYDYYKTKLLRNSFDGKGHQITGMAHTGVKYNNAHFDGTFAFFGDGDDITDNPWASLDICGHEISHGLTKSTADLYYMDEMGALNESFSDIFGKCVEHYYSPSSFNWKIGDLIRGSGVRNMQDPNTNSLPRYYRGKYYYSGTADNGGVHTNSSVQNFWFYLLCQGGTGIREDDGKPYSVKAIGLNKAEQIAYSTLADYLFPLAQYKDAATYSLEATKALYGIASDEYEQVKEAWYAVGVTEKPTIIREENSNADFFIYPSPTKANLYINHGSIPGGNYIIYNEIGQAIINGDINPGNNVTEISVINLRKGIYCIKTVYDKGSVQIDKFVKE